MDIGGGFELRSVFLFKCPAPGKSSWVKKVQVPHTRVINLLGEKIQLKRSWLPTKIAIYSLLLFRTELRGGHKGFAVVQICVIFGAVLR